MFARIGVAELHWALLNRGIILPLIDADLPRLVVIDWECEADDPSEDWSTQPSTPPTQHQPSTSDQSANATSDSPEEVDSNA